MIEVFRDISSARVGLIDSMLQSAGIETLVRNWNVITFTTEIPIPEMYPNICVYSEEDASAAREIIASALDGESESDI